MVGEHDVRIRSYLLWEAAGRPHGREVEFWLRAEAELQAEVRCAVPAKPGPFVLPRLPISSPPRRSVAMRVRAREHAQISVQSASIAANL